MPLAQSMRRHLLEASPDVQNTEISVVRTAQELQAAVDEGFEHIEIQDHLGLMELGLRDSAIETQAILVIPSSVKSLTGNCTAEISDEDIAQFPFTSPLLPLKPAQCLLLFTEAALSVPPSENSDGKLWLDNLYFRYVSPAGIGSTDVAAPEDLVLPQQALSQLRATTSNSGSSSISDTPMRRLDSLWLTNITIQGDGTRPLSGAHAEGRLYAEDCIFSHLGPGAPSARVAQDAASGAFHSCTFQNILSNDSSVGVLEGSGRSGLLVKDSVFLRNDVEALFVANDTAGMPLFYTDAADEVVEALVGADLTPLPLAALGTSSIQFLDSDVGGSPEVAQQVDRGSRVVRLIQSEQLGLMTVVAIVLSCTILFFCACVGFVAWFLRHSGDEGWSRFKPSQSAKHSTPVSEMKEAGPREVKEPPRQAAAARWRASPVAESRAHEFAAPSESPPSYCVMNPVFSPSSSSRLPGCPSTIRDGASLGDHPAPGASASSAACSFTACPATLRERGDPLDSLGSLSVELDQ